MEDYTKYITAIPVIPDIAAKVLSIREDDINISFKELEDLIKVDPGLSTKILKVANSALYARQKEITSLQSAITLLGFKTIKSLVFLVSASSLFKKPSDRAFYSRFWQHSIITAFISQSISERLGSKQKTDEAFLAGLFHDIGKTAMYQFDRELFYQMDDTTSEIAAFGADHKEIGEEILNAWHFPSIYVDVARELGNMNITSRHKTLILIVSAADIIAQYYTGEQPTITHDERLPVILKKLNMDSPDLDFYETSFYEKMIKDPVFQECSSLFGISS